MKDKRGKQVGERLDSVNAADDSLGKGSSKLYAGKTWATRPEGVTRWNEAQDMLDRGVSPEEVRQKTGWFRGKYDGKLRFEIDDSKSEWRKPESILSIEVNAANKALTSAEAHIAELQKKYPHMSKAEIFFGGTFEFSVPTPILQITGKLGHDWLGNSAEHIEIREQIFQAVSANDPSKLPQPKHIGTVIEGFIKDTKYAKDRDGNIALSDIFKHDELYAAYPELKDIKVGAHKLQDGILGGFNEATNTIALNEAQTPDEAHATILHEIQHWIQNKEVLAQGGSVKPRLTKKINEMSAKITRIDFASMIRQKLPDVQMPDSALRSAIVMMQSLIMSTGISKSAQKVLSDPASVDEIITLVRTDMMQLAQMRNDTVAERNKLAQEMMNRAIQKYKNIPGEIESRDVEGRQKLTKEERKQRQPYSTENIPEEKATKPRKPRTPRWA